MAIRNLLNKLLDTEKEIKENIIAISIADTEGPAEWSKCYEVFFENRINGIECARKEIMDLLLDEFNDDYGTPEGHPFTAWTKNYVIFPTEDEGSESIAYVKRNPCNFPTDHI